MALSSNFEYVDYSASFTNIPARNRILTNLGIFQRDTTDQFKTSLDILAQMGDSVAPAGMRFGSQWGSTPKASASNHLIELPLFPTQDIITAADVQPYRKAGSPLQASVLDAVTAKGLAHYERFAATREKMFAESLFRHRVIDMQYTQDGPTLDWSNEFGIEQSTGTIYTGVAADPLESLSDEVSKMKRRAGGLASQLKGIYLFAGSNLFKKLRFNPSVRQLVQYGVLDPDGLVFNREINPAFSYFVLDSVTVVEMSDTDFYGVGADQGYLVPVFDKPLSGQSGAWTNIVGPTSRNLELAFADVVDFRIYSNTDAYKNITLSSEFSMLPVAFRPDLCTAITNDAS